MGSSYSKFYQSAARRELAKPVRSVQAPKPSEALVMKTVDSDWMKVTNQTAHRTFEYETQSLVLRRGQTFKVKMTFQRPYNKYGDKVYLEFTIGKSPQLVNDTKVRIPISETLDTTKWSMVLDDSTENTITLEVNIPPNAIVGRYNTTVEFTSELQDGQVVTSRDKEPDLIVIFNPWCEDDTVYMSDEDQRQEYVLSDTGIIYRGSTRRKSPKRWNFGQFEENILECAMYLLDSDKRTTSNNGKWIPKRRDPVWVVRAASAMVNSQDDNGVLTGNWSGDYSGGSSPLIWNGSVKILQQYFKTKQPVQFGQCWVFSGVVTTVLRALGIPTRSVTNFASAHDTENSMTIDKYFDADTAEEIEGIGGDSVWNFHVWNESWMKRPDLPTGYDGWQVIDATPQEVSLGLFQTGPAPLTAIKKGEIYLGYETPFVFAEVNSDRVSWIVKKEEGTYVIQGAGQTYTSAVGKFISTKKVGADEREDLTDQYKHPEGSAEERAAFRLAYGFGSQPDYQRGFLHLQEEELKDGINFEFTTAPTDELLYNGDEFTVKVTLTNKSATARTLDLITSLHSTMYTGVKRNFIKRSNFQGIKLEGNASVSKEFKVSYSDYGSKLVDQNAVVLNAVASVKETKKMFADDYEFRLENKEDAVDIKVNDPLKVGQSSAVTVHFTNTLPVKLTNVTVTLEGARILDAVTKKVSGHLLPGATTEVTFNISPKRGGQGRMLLADVDSRQQEDMKKSIYVDVAGM